jgi:hypothetical protein
MIYDSVSIYHYSSKSQSIIFSASTASNGPGNRLFSYESEGIAVRISSSAPLRNTLSTPKYGIHHLPFGPGGFADITIRLLGQKFTERTGGQVIIENRPGAGGIVAANSVLSSPADGYTPFVFSSGIALSLPFWPFE